MHTDRALLFRQLPPAAGRRWWRLGAVLALGAALAGGAWAAADGEPEPKRYGEVEYVTGEIGLEQSDVVASANYNLGLTFASQGGEFLGEVRVVVTDDRQATVLDITTDGPRLLARLPPERYRVTASFAGQTVTRDAVVEPRKRIELEFLWPLDASVAGAARHAPFAAARPGGG